MSDKWSEKPTQIFNVFDIELLRVVWAWRNIPNVFCEINSICDLLKKFF